LALERGGPRDLAAIGKAVAVALGLGQKLVGVADLPEVLTGLSAILAQAPDTLAAEFAAALADDLPLLIRDGGFVRAGFDARLDEERALGSETRAVVAALQARLMDETDVRSLKIKHNGVLGFLVEVPAAQGQELLGAADRGDINQPQARATP